MKLTRTLALGVLSVLTLAGCASDLITVRKLPQEAPTDARYLYSAACECMGRRVEQYLENNELRMLLLTDEIIDGTSRDGVLLESKLSHGGQNVIQHLTNQYIDRKYVVQPLALPLDLAHYFRNGQRLSRDFYADLLNGHSSDTIMAFNGEFTANDQTGGSDGHGATARYSSDDTTVTSDTGNRSDGGLINFVLKVGDPLKNEIVHTVGLQAPVTRNNRTRSFTVGYKHAGLGFSKTEVNVDGLHNVQENVIAAAWFYAWAGLLPGDAASSCLGTGGTSPTQITEWLRQWENWTKKQQISALQLQLNRYAVSADMTPINVDGKLGEDTWERIRAVELKLGLSPHSRGSLDGLYTALLQAQPQDG